jgi:hypothetical protein
MKNYLQKLNVVAVGAFAVVAVSGFFVVNVASAATWNVSVGSSGACTTGDPNCATIQAAVSAAAPGDTVNVASGTYDGGIGISQGLILEGPNAGIDPNTGTRVPEAIIDNGSPAIRISTTDPVTISGFTFSGTGTPIDSYTTGNTPTIENNIITNTTSSGNLFFANSGIFTFENNQLSQLDPHSNEGIQLAGNWNGATGTVVTMTGNVWENSAMTGINASNVSGNISNNTFSHITYYGLLIANNSSPLMVSSNTFENITSPDPTVATYGAGVRFYNPALTGPVTITGNAFTNDVVGVAVRPTDGGASSSLATVAVNANTFVGDTTGVINAPLDTILNATGNWWGNASGPYDATSTDGSIPTINASGTGSPAIGAVNYANWCVNTACATPIAPTSTYTVTIDKFIDGSMATASSAAGIAFPMNATWNAINLGAAGTGSYTLSTTGFNSPNAYEAITSPMNASSSYATNEDVTGSFVGADCSVGDPYALVGYSTGTSFAAAASSSVSMTAPNLASLGSNEYIIVWNKNCLPAPTLLSPADGTATTTAGLTSTNWNPVTDPAGGITYVYQASNSSTTNPDGSFVNPVYTSGPLTATMIPTPNTPAGTYFWHVQAKDADGNVSPWSGMWMFTIANTGSLTVEKNTIGGNGTFTFTGNNGLGAFSITTASGTGSDTFNGVTPGTYTIAETNIPKGWTQTDSDCATMVVTAGGADACTITNTSNKLLGEIRGTKYVDKNGDGTLKGGDHNRLAGVTIYLDLNNNGKLDSGEPSMVTNKLGEYHFSNLPAGTYHVREVEQSGWIETMPVTGSYTIVLPAGKDSKNNNFGDFKLGTISGSEYNDLNNNGHQNKGEPALVGWTINLMKVGSPTIVATTVTDANGNYSFVNLAPGTYQVREVLQSGWYETTQNPPNVTIYSGVVSKNNIFGNHFGKVTKNQGYHGNQFSNGRDIGFGGGR